MKIVVVGSYRYEIYAPALCRGFRSLGHEVIEHDEESFLGKGRAARLQDKISHGPGVAKFNRKLREVCERERPDAVFLFRPIHVRPATLRHIKRARVKPILLSYNNDNAFGSSAPPYYWRNLVAGLKEVDVAFAHRDADVPHLVKAGAKEIQPLRSWYLPWSHKPSGRPDFAAEVIFIGHFENDGRLELLEAVARNHKLALFGTGWDAAISRESPLYSHLPIKPVHGPEYPSRLSSAKLALCFLSKLNRDDYTRRCFEIPATGTVLVTERTPFLETLFREDEEAVFFSSPAEAQQKVAQLLADEDWRTRVGKAGRQRVIADGHDVISRANDIVSCINRLRKDDATATTPPIQEASS